MQFSGKICDKLIFPLAVIILASLATTIGSKISTDKWMIWFLYIPKWFWICFSVIVFLWIITVLVNRRIKHLKELDKPTTYFFSVPFHGWRTIGKLPYKNVIWDISVPNEILSSPIEPSDVEVLCPPRCPKCKTYIEEKRSFWGGYIWTCVKCGYKKRNKESYSIEAQRVENIARREVEINLEKKTNIKKY